MGLIWGVIFTPKPKPYVLYRPSQKPAVSFGMAWLIALVLGIIGATIWSFL